MHDLFTLLDALADGAIALDGTTIRRVNLAFARGLGYDDAAELAGCDLGDLLCVEEAASAAELERRLASTEPIELRLRTRSGGASLWELSPPRPLPVVGGATWSLCCAREVSARRRREEQALVADRLTSASTLIAGVAHEISNPLAAVLANVEISLRNLDGPPDELAVCEMREALADARDAAERLRHVVRDIRMFSQADGGGRGPTDVNRILESTLRVAGSRLRRRARLMKDLSPVPMVIASDAELGQVFLNLLTHAALSIPEGNVSQNAVRVATRSLGDRVEIELMDTGHGMSSAAAQHVFAPFAAGAGDAMGLGLAVCHRIVTSLGGEIEVESRPDLGSRFVITLPVAPGKTVEDELVERAMRMAGMPQVPRA